MRVIRISDHFIVCSIGSHPLVLAILDLKIVNELLLKIVRILSHKELGPLTELRHLLGVVCAALVLRECIFILALLLAHLTVKLVLS